MVGLSTAMFRVSDISKFSPRACEFHVFVFILVIVLFWVIFVVVIVFASCVCSMQHGFSPVEQASNIIKRKIGYPINNRTTIALVGTFCLASLYCSLQGLCTT